MRRRRHVPQPEIAAGHDVPVTARARCNKGSTPCKHATHRPKLTVPARRPVLRIGSHGCVRSSQNRQHAVRRSFRRHFRHFAPAACDPFGIKCILLKHFAQNFAIGGFYQPAYGYIRSSVVPRGCNDAAFDPVARGIDPACRWNPAGEGPIQRAAQRGIAVARRRSECDIEGQAGFGFLFSDAARDDAVILCREPAGYCRARSRGLRIPACDFFARLPPRSCEGCCCRRHSTGLRLASRRVWSFR